MKKSAFRNAKCVHTHIHIVPKAVILTGGFFFILVYCFTFGFLELPCQCLSGGLTEIVCLVPLHAGPAVTENRSLPHV